MRVLHFLHRNPIAILALVTVGFIAWLWRDALPTAQQPPSEPSVRPDPNLPLQRKIPLPPGVVLSGPLSPQQAGQVLPKLKLGMTRTEVESLVGTPSPADVLPATVADGKVTYRIAYDADLSPPVPIRPIRPRRPIPKEFEPQPKDRMLVMLEFDATKTGHPLLEIHYPDPLF